MTEKQNNKFGKLEWLILFASLIFIIFSFFAPYILSNESNWDIDFTSTGQIGDTIGGIMNPFIALAGVLLTFLAFYIQFKANRLQYNNFKFEIEEQRLQFSKSQFENQFYEMLRLHKENVNELRIEQIFTNSEKEKSREIIVGRKVFDLLKTELEILILLAKKHFPDSDINLQLNEAYGIFFHGVKKQDNSKHDFFDDAIEIQKMYGLTDFADLNRAYQYKIKTEYYIKEELHYQIFLGHSHQIAHYYRHLFQTVKFVVSQSENLLSYEDKRRYLRILRAQLSNNEQAMLFYNWLSKFGKQWENDENKFFTDYRMVHNVYNALLVSGITLENIFDFSQSYKKEKNRSIDVLFEFQDWD